MEVVLVMDCDELDAMEVLALMEAVVVMVVEVVE